MHSKKFTVKGAKDAKAGYARIKALRRMRELIALRAP